ncbi:tail fiber assembly protein [Caballeronia sp. dw_19]|uniref:tail fiber assembly protein n=1 Tax=Caballeronia sp. dw_19 TaxID=2719791 RepID=UPI001BD46F23|nr:tail fiber assembly protein [Caballeronia sp. dw_19]
MSTIPVLHDSQAGNAAFQVGDVTGPRWANAESTMISCTVTFPNHPMGLTQPMPFTADAQDSEIHSRALFYRLRSGEFGPVAAYVAPDDAAIAEQARTERDQLLRESDWTQGRDVPPALSEAWAPYRQALREISDQPGFPRSIEWPTQPKA